MGLQLLYVALGDEDRIAIYERGPAGALTLRGHAACAGGPMWLCANPGLTHVHACTVNTSELVSFRVDEGTGALVELHRLAYPALSPLDPHGQPWTGPGVPCHMSMDQTGRYIFTAFYTAGIVTVHGVDKAEGGGGSGGGGGHAVGPAVQVLATSHGCHSAQVEPRGNADVYVPCVAAWAMISNLWSMQTTDIPPPMPSTLVAHWTNWMPIGSKNPSRPKTLMGTVNCAQACG